MENNKTGASSILILILAIAVVIVFLIAGGLFYKNCSCEVGCHCSYLAYIVLGCLLVIIMALLVVYIKLTNNHRASLEADIYENHLKEAITLAKSSNDPKAMLAIINTLIQRS